MRGWTSIMDKHVNVGEGCTADTVLVINSGSQEAVQRYKDTYGFQEVYTCDATAAAEKTIGLSIPNSAMLGALAKTGLVSIEAVESAVRDSFGKVGEKNAQAARYAYEHTCKA